MLLLLNCKLHLTLCDPMDCSTPGFPVLHYCQEFAQIHIHSIIQYIAQIYSCHLILRTHSSFTDYLNNFFLLKRFNSEACSDWASQVTLVVRNLLVNTRHKRCRFDPWVGQIPWRRAWQPTPVFVPGEFHG